MNTKGLLTSCIGKYKKVALLYTKGNICDILHIDDGSDYANRFCI